MAADLAADIVALLSSGAELVDAAADGADAGAEPVGPGDIAVLVATHRQAALVRDALDAVGVPAVIGGAGSVFGTPVAQGVAAPCSRRSNGRPRRPGSAPPR